MTTDNVEQVEGGNEQQTENVQRDVSELLRILQTEGTYQGMTDAEIQSIVDHEKHCARMAGKTEQMESAQNTQYEYMRTRMNASLQAQETMLQSIIDRATNPQMQVVQYG